MCAACGVARTCVRCRGDARQSALVSECRRGSPGQALSRQLAQTINKPAGFHLFVRRSSGRCAKADGREAARGGGAAAADRHRKQDQLGARSLAAGTRLTSPSHTRVPRPVLRSAKINVLLCLIVCVRVTPTRARARAHAHTRAQRRTSIRAHKCARTHAHLLARAWCIAQGLTAVAVFYAAPCEALSAHLAVLPRATACAGPEPVDPRCERSLRRADPVVHVRTDHPAHAAAPCCAYGDDPFACAHGLSVAAQTGGLLVIRSHACRAVRAQVRPGPSVLLRADLI